MRAGLERTSKAPVVTSQGLGSQCWSVSQDIFDHPVSATPAGLEGDDDLKATWGIKSGAKGELVAGSGEPQQHLGAQHISWG